VTLRQSARPGTGTYNSSIPLGNRTPLVAMKITSGHEEALFSSAFPETRRKARELLCGPGGLSETRPAWTEEGPTEHKRVQLWKELVAACALERGFPINRRGLFVGISAVYYAAVEAGCENKLMEVGHFLKCLENKRQELLSMASGNGRLLANLTLVAALVQTVLHTSALIVCKRRWVVGEEVGENPVDFVATWTLGLYLKQSGLLDMHVMTAEDSDIV